MEAVKTLAACVNKIVSLIVREAKRAILSIRVILISLSETVVLHSAYIKPPTRSFATWKIVFSLCARSDLRCLGSFLTLIKKWLMFFPTSQRSIRDRLCDVSDG